MIYMIDNYDSFTYNIVQYLKGIHSELIVARNDETSIQKIEQTKPDYILLGPGPCTPKEAGISMEMIQYFSGKIPILGVCLGHEAIGEVFGGKVIQSKKMMHGKNSDIFHNDSGCFKNLPNPVNCTRYHSLSVEKESLPNCLEITGWTEDGEIMGLAHKTLAVEGVQFHPEAFLTEHGLSMFQNFLTQHKK